MRVEERRKRMPAPSGEVKGAADELQRFAMGVMKQNTKNVYRSSRYINLSFKTLYAMYLALFIVGMVSSVLAIYKGLTDPQIASVATLGGLSIASFLSLFLTRPLESLERTSIFTSWLTAVMNTYWSRLMYFSDLTTIDRDLDDATKDLVNHLKAMAETHTAALAKYQPPSSAEPAPSYSPPAQDYPQPTETPSADTAPLPEPSGEASENPPFETSIMTRSLRALQETPQRSDSVLQKLNKRGQPEF